MKNNKDTLFEVANLKRICDTIDDVIYVADPETYELLFVNAEFSKFWGEDVVGQKCYYVLQNLEKPCDFCSNNKIFGNNAGKKYVWEFQNLVNKRWYKCVDKAIPWDDGRLVRVEIASDITELKTAEGTIDKRNAALKERYKELNCLYASTKIMLELDGNPKDIFAQLVELIEISMQYPEISCARIVYRDFDVKSEKWTETKWKISADLIEDNTKVGFIETIYLNDKNRKRDKAFLPEEKEMLATLATNISIYLKRKKTNDELKRYKITLEEKVKERTKELEEAYASLKKQIEEKRRKDEIIESQSEEILRLNERRL